MSQRDIDFEWSTEKAAINLRKHDVTFEEAETVFDDPMASTQADEAHSNDVNG